MKKLLIVGLTVLLTGCFEPVAAPTPTSTKPAAVWGDASRPEAAAKWDNVKWQ